MIPSAKYPAKVLLFGEYSILVGSEALAFPLPGFSGYLKYACVNEKPGPQAQKSQEVLIKLYQYLDQHTRKCTSLDNPNINRLRNDIISGLFFCSNIPENYGIGSSGALSAAIYDSYFDQTKQRPTEQIINCLSLVESFFHEQSSGIDPLVSLYSKPYHLKDGLPTAIPLDFTWVKDNLNMVLIDSGITGSTKEGIQRDYQARIPKEYIELNNTIIQSVLRKQNQDLPEKLQLLSKLQLEIFADLFPSKIAELAKTGLSSGKYCIKLCGSGGGGYFLMFLHGKEKPENIDLQGLKIQSLFEE